jgi:hypothetical protein
MSADLGAKGSHTALVVPELARSEGDRMVLDLQGGKRRTLTTQLADSAIQLFQGGRPLRAVDVADAVGTASVRAPCIDKLDAHTAFRCRWTDAAADGLWP